MIITFKNFKYISEADKVLIWQWRNSDRIRLQMANQDFIELDAHLNWMSGLGVRNDCLYYLVHDNEKPIGVFYLTNIDRNNKTAQWGFYLDLNTRPGFGIVGFFALEHYFTDLGFARMNSQVMKSNEKSLKWHRKLLFSEVYSPIGNVGLSHLTLGWETWQDQSGELRESIFASHPGCLANWQE